MKRLIVWSAVLVSAAGVAYLATLGCCHLLGVSRRPVSSTQGLDLTPVQKEQVAPLEKQYLARKQASCAALCAKRAQLIRLLQVDPVDSQMVDGLIREIAQEQTALEKATVDYLLAVRQHLDGPQRQRLAARVSDELRLACKATACGMTPGCTVTEAEKR